jgi:hypothetical protein
MNNKGQIGILSYFTLLFFFVAFWALYLASWLTQIGADAVANNNLTGFEAFAFTYLNLWVFLGVLLALAIGAFAARGGV